MNSKRIEELFIQLSSGATNSVADGFLYKDAACVLEAEFIKYQDLYENNQRQILIDFAEWLYKKDYANIPNTMIAEYLFNKQNNERY